MIPNSDLLDALPAAVYVTDAEGRITLYNTAAADLWGRRPELGSKWCGSWRLYWPDGRPLPHDESPMAVALKEGRPVRGLQAVAERPDGTRVAFRPYPTPLKDATGRVTGAINMLVDVGDQQSAEIVSERLAAIVASSDDAIVSKSLDGRIASWNAGASRIFGYEASEMIGQSITRIIPPDLLAEEQEILAKLRRGERIDHYETVRLTKSGARIDVSITVSALRNAAGQIVGASKIARDITERKHAEKLQSLLTEELNHRVKNTLAMVQAIATQSLGHAKNQSDFVAGFAGRLQALARAHSLLTQAKMQGAELAEIVREQVLLGNSGDGRISYAGPLVMLNAQEALHLAIVLHELATNARKYGALSVPDGRLSIDWQTRSQKGQSLLLLWKETGGPKVSATNARGFGSTLIEQTLLGHGGEVSVQYTGDGLACQIELPLANDVRLDVANARAPEGVGKSLLGSYDNRSSRLNGARIVVIEDEPLVAMDLEASLTGAGCKVIGPAGNLERAQRLIAESEFDIALLDVNLSGQPVDELAAALAQKNIPFAFVTGYGRTTLPSAFRDAVVLSKPFSRDQLLAVVGGLLDVTRLIPAVVQFRHKKL